MALVPGTVAQDGAESSPNRRGPTQFLRTAKRFCLDLYGLAAPYFLSLEWRSAWGLLTLVIALSLLQIGLGLAISFSQNIFYTALQQRDPSRFLRGLFWFTARKAGLPMPPFVGLALLNIAFGAFNLFLQGVLQIRWQRWLTARIAGEWLSGHAFYRMAITRGGQEQGADNPDQRIQEDIEDVTRNAITLTIGLLTATGTAISYGGLLWSLSGHARIFGFAIPGYLFWSALVFAALCTFVTHAAGRRLAPLNFTQQRFRGNFRFSLVKIRENAEAIALLGGEAEERRGLSARFADLYGNFLRIIRRTALVNFLGISAEQASIVFPTVIAAPRFFAGEITFGTLTQIRLGFLYLAEAMLWFVTSYANLAAFAAQTKRLSTFQREIAAAAKLPQGITAVAAQSGQLDTEDLTLAAPAGKILLRAGGITIGSGIMTAIMGASGIGKSTLLRALAGIWPFGEGCIALPPGRRMVLPQRPYLPAGSLRRALCYPADPASIADNAVLRAMTISGLAGLAPLLDADEDWLQKLSPGEQQRVCIARAVLAGSDWLFLDEATSALDGPSEAALYRMLREEMPHATIVSVTHRAELARQHDAVLTLGAGQAGQTAVA